MADQFIVPTGGAAQGPQGGQLDRAAALGISIAQ